MDQRSQCLGRRLHPMGLFHPGKTLRRQLVLCVVMCLLGALLVLCGGSARAEEPSPTLPPAELTSAWHYRYGDSPPLPQARFAWSLPDAQDAGWAETEQIGNPPGRNHRSFLWLRSKLVGPPLRDPALSLLVVDQIFEAYLDGELVYTFGVLDGPTGRRFRGYPQHIISLPKDYEGKTLTLRIYSEHINIGVFGRPRLGEHRALLVESVQQGLGRLLVGSILCILGIATFVVSMIRRNDRSLLYYAGFQIFVGLYVLAQTQFRNLLWDVPLLWTSMELGSLCLGAAAMAAFVSDVFGSGPAHLLRRASQLLLGYFFVAGFAVIAGWVPLLATLLPVQIMILLCFVVGLLTLIDAARRGKADIWLFVLGFVVFVGCAIYDILVAIDVLPRQRLTVTHYGLAALSLSMGSILIGRLIELQHRVRDYASLLQLTLSDAPILDAGEHAKLTIAEVQKLLQAERVLLFICHGADGKLTLEAGLDAQGRSISEPVDYDAQITKQTVLTRRPRRGIREVRGLATDQGAQVRIGTAAAPLLVRGEMLGVLYVESDSRRGSFSEASLELLVALGNQVALALVSVRAIRLEVERTVHRQQIDEQDALLKSVARMAGGDLTTEVKAPQSSHLASIATALERLRTQVQSQIHQLELSHSEVTSLNAELRRQVEQRSDRLMDALLRRYEGSLSPDFLSPGKMLGTHYKIIRQLGKGAMGIVFEVERVTEKKRFAAKIMLSSGDKTTLLRFAREAKLLSKLHHPNLIAIYDIDVTDRGVLYLVMELVKGRTLRDYQDHFGQVPFALSALVQIAKGLQAIHEQGIVHRDLKPANILVEDGEGGGQPVCKLADFGISTLVGTPPVESGEYYAEVNATGHTKVVKEEDESATADLMPGDVASGSGSARSLTSSQHGRHQLTQTGMIVGTPMYMAPELATGSSQAQSPADIFGFGIMAFELLTKRIPFPRPPIWMMLRGEPFPAPSHTLKDVALPVELAELLQRCLDRQPAARPTAKELVEAIERHQSIWSRSKG